jgi:endonuclease/exonuclease/phosphatase (EEP) superfamily protein YafD
VDVLRWWFDSALNLAPHLLVVAAVAAALSAFERQWTLAVPLAIVAIALGGWHSTGEALLERPRPCGSRAPLSLATANVQSRFGAEEVVERIGYQPDVLVIQEAPLRERAPSTGLYAHRHASDPPWLQVLAREAASEFSLTTIFGHEDGRAVVRLEVPLEDARVTVVALHGLAPVRLSNFRGRAQQFATIEGIARGVDGPLVVLGDLNATVNSPALRTLLRRAGLRSAAAPGRETPTWPAVGGPLGLRLDHVLVRDITVCAVEVSSPISDHRAVLVDVALNEARRD